MKYTVCEWMSIQIVSHPEWVCGLKFRYYTEKKISTYIAPFVGARVEMQQFLRETTSERSHPEWVCGLKCRYRSVTLVLRVSHLLGARVEI